MQMTIWHIQKLYTDDGITYDVIPYDLLPTVQSTLKMKNGMKQTIKFLLNSRLSEKLAQEISNKKER